MTNILHTARIEMSMSSGARPINRSLKCPIFPQTWAAMFDVTYEYLYPKMVAFLNDFWVTLDKDVIKKLFKSRNANDYNSLCINFLMAARGKKTFIWRSIASKCSHLSALRWPKTDQPAFRTRFAWEIH